MTKTTARLAGFGLLLLTALPMPAARAATRRCLRTCGSAIAACVDAGGKPRRCRRRILHQCTRNAAVCAPIFSSTTSTTLPFGVSPIDLTVSTVETLYEVGFLVPAAGSKFVRVTLELTNRSGAAASPASPILYTGGLGYQPTYQYAPPGVDNGYCGVSNVIPGGGTLSCRPLYQVPEDATKGTVGFQTYGTYPTNDGRSDEFDIPSVPRPFAAVTVTAVDDVGAPCVPRPGFRLVQIHVSLESHQGATEMTLGGQWSVVADDARYQTAYCFFPADPCEDHIGVPTNGAASCSLLFEVPLTADAARLDYTGNRYSASASFMLLP
jgi:hypothetical protein